MENSGTFYEDLNESKTENSRLNEQNTTGSTADSTESSNNFDFEDKRLQKKWNGTKDTEETV